MAGSSGAFRTRKHPDGRGNAGVYEITASYTDDGAEDARAITGKATHVLHARMKKAGFFDTRDGVELIDEYEGEHTIVGHFAVAKSGALGRPEKICRPRRSVASPIKVTRNA